MPARRRPPWYVCLALDVHSTTGWATSQRTFVGSIGTDNPNCSIAAPCRSFTAAITATNPGGEIIVQDSAGYGTVTITKSVSIIAPPGIYAGISVTSGDGITINAPGATVVLRGLSINGQGGSNGILLQAADRVRVENCVVSGMGAVGIYHQADNGEMIVVDTIVRDNHDGIGLVAANGSITLDHVRSEHHQVVGFYMAPTPGASTARAAIADSLFAENGSHGLWVDSAGGATTYIDLSGSVVSGNSGIGFYATAAAAGAQIFASLMRNTFQKGNGAYVVHLVGLAPGEIRALASENVFSRAGQLFIEGSGNFVTASGNSGSTFDCNGGSLITYANNYFDLIFPCGTHTTKSGY